MTDVNSPSPLRSADGYLASSTTYVAFSAAAGTLTTVALAVPSSNADRPEGEFSVDVYNFSSGLGYLFFSAGASAPSSYAIPGATGGAYVIGGGERRTFLVPPNTKWMGIAPLAASQTNGIAATVGRGRA